MGRRILGVALCLGLCMALWNGASCYSIPEPGCGFICDPDTNACPANYTCNLADKHCHLNGSTDSCPADAAPGDSPLDGNLQPFVVATMPIANQVGIDPSSSITARFNVNVGPFDSTTFEVLTGPGSFPIPGTYSYDPESFTATFVPETALPTGEIDVTLTSGIANDLGATLTEYTWSFTTLDNVAPTLASSMPIDMDMAVLTSTPILVRFSEPVNGVDTTSFAVTQGVTHITGTIVGVGQTSYTFTPTAALPGGSTITVTLSAAIEDLAGNPLVPVTFSFTTM